MLALTTRGVLKWIAIIVAVPVTLVLLAATVLRLDFAGTPAEWAKSTGNDALWLGHAWVDGRRTAADVDALATRLGSIKDVYVHSGPLTANGTLRPEKYPNATNLLSWWKERLPGVRISAWLGQTVNAKDGGHLNLSDQATRARIVQGAKTLIDLGFDGIHYDFEPVPDGDPAYPALMRETRQAIGQKVLSVATQQIEPAFGAQWAFQLVAGHGKYWSPEYFREMAELSDQVAIMTYDSWTPLQSLYGGYVARQTAMALEVVPDDTTLLIGAPAYHDHMAGVSDYAESVEMAAEGARLALTQHGPRQNLGLALYVDFAATEQDWREYHEYWVRPG
ncbi:glycosyl hydrolase family 18 protein [Acrocarpospora catenulata]|uniref:glycosyl hydrolase family 18 protein n=1 Tax=Acrocarpospora catenulata TaxID=2836182 RepID=UPI001BD948D5|nr:glycosyl hydrolase family 18 protein [Acrocarpospora catenulata]